MKTLTIELPDELWAAFEHRAAREGRSVEEVAVEWVAKHGPKRRPNLPAAERRAARDEFRQFMGILDSGDPHSADNERIDADLARGYGDTHEEKP